MLAPYNQAVPLIIASVAVGTTIVNRAPLKLVGHLVGAIFVGLISAVWTKLFVTAFLCYTIGYVCTCFKNGLPDAFILTGIILGFAALMILNIMVYSLTSSYYFTVLASTLLGFGGVYATEAIFGSQGLYDFKGCSCADCANANQCPSKSGDGSGPKILARRIS
jgi:multisubunit Na+/H+ antiporter MnhC subunit